MGQIAFHSKTGEIIEAFSLNDEQWMNIRAEPIGALSMPLTDWPAVPKISNRGLRYFAHLSGFQGIKPKPESYAHTRLKIDIAKAARKLGYTANLEASSECQGGYQWRADVLVTDTLGQKTAFEVQLSSQTLEEYRHRTARYKASDVGCCWVLMQSPPKHGRQKIHALDKAISHENIEKYKETGLFQCDDENLLTLRAFLENKDTYPEERRTLCLLRSTPVEHLEIEEAISRVLKNKFRWKGINWQWSDD